MMKGVSPTMLRIWHPSLTNACVNQGGLLSNPWQQEIRDYSNHCEKTHLLCSKQPS